MTIYFIDEGFEDEDPNYDRSKGPWEQGHHWDDINLFITFDEEEPYKGEECILVGTNDMWIDPENFYDYGYEPSWGVWEGPLDQSFFKRAIEVAFDV